MAYVTLSGSEVHFCIGHEVSRHTERAGQTFVEVRVDGEWRTIGLHDIRASVFLPVTIGDIAIEDACLKDPEGD